MKTTDITKRMCSRVAAENVFNITGVKACVLSRCRTEELMLGQLGAAYWARAPVQSNTHPPSILSFWEHNAFYSS